MGKRGIAWVLLSGWLIVLVMTVSLIAGVLYFYRSDRILPGVRVLDIELGNKTKAEAAALLTDIWKARGVTLDAGFQAWTVSREAAGIVLDIDATVQRAHTAGRSLHDMDDAAAALDRIVAELQGKPPTPIKVTPVWRFDRDIAAATLREIAARIAVDPQNADVRVEDGRVVAIPSVTGRALDLATTMTRITADPWALVSSGQAPLAVVELTPEIPDVTKVVSQTNRLLDNQLNVRLYDPIADVHLAWAPDAETMAGWLTFQPDPLQPDRLKWSLNREAVSADLDAATLARSTERMISFGAPYAATDKAVSELMALLTTGGGELSLRVYHAPRQHLVEAGENLSSIAFRYGIPYPWIQAANPGLGDTLLAGETITIPSPDGLVPLPPVENKRIQVSLSLQRLRAYEDGELKWEWPVSTGIASSPTSPGVFQVQSHEISAYAANWNLWMPYFLGIYRPVPNQAFMNGFHGFPTRDQRQLLWTNDLGRPVTYGCILLSTENAIALYDWAEEGVIVEVTA